MRFSFGTARQWHWISAAVSLAGMLLFAVTGITLNHASDIPASTTVRTVESKLTADMTASLPTLSGEELVTPEALRQWLAQTHDIDVPTSAVGEFDGVELYVAWPGPGRDQWLAVDVEMGGFIFESTDRGWVAYFNDLHKGRHTGIVWIGFIDVIAIAIIVFTLSGLWLLLKQSSYKPSTWPVTALGLLVPVVIALVFIH